MKRRLKHYSSRQLAFLSFVAVASAFISSTAPIITTTAVTEPMFKDLVTGNSIDSQLDPQAKAILEAAAKSGGLPAEIQAKRKAFDALFADLGG